VNAEHLQQIAHVQILVLHKIELLLEYEVDVIIYKNQPKAQYRVSITYDDKTNKCMCVSATLVAILREILYEGCITKTL
jgi:hypothetical protein